MLRLRLSLRTTAALLAAAPLLVTLASLPAHGSDSRDEGIAGVEAKVSLLYASIAALSIEGDYGNASTIATQEGLKWELAAVEAASKAARATDEGAAGARSLAAAEAAARNADLYRRAYEAFRADDFAASARLAHEACASGGAPSCVLIGYLTARGEGVASDITRSVELYRKACDAGFGLGCSNLASAYYSGEGVVPDQQRAAELYTTGCDAGSAIACGNLAGLYRDGKGVEQDPEKSQQFHQKACDGDLSSHCKLARQ
jgi:TPR repeat protein